MPEGGWKLIGTLPLKVTSEKEISDFHIVLRFCRRGGLSYMDKEGTDELMT